MAPAVGSVGTVAQYNFLWVVFCDIIQPAVVSTLCAIQYYDGSIVIVGDEHPFNYIINYWGSVDMKSIWMSAMFLLLISKLINISSANSYEIQQNNRDFTRQRFSYYLLFILLLIFYCGIRNIGLALPLVFLITPMMYLGFCSLEFDNHSTNRNPSFLPRLIRKSLGILFSPFVVALGVTTACRFQNTETTLCGVNQLLSDASLVSCHGHTYCNNKF